MRVKGDPLAVRRPRHCLIFGVRILEHFAWLSGRIREPPPKGGGYTGGYVGGYIDDTNVLRDVGILRVIDHATPGAVGERDQRTGRVIRRRLGLKRRQLASRAAWPGS